MARVDRDQFAHIRRMRDNRFAHEIAAILPGEFFVSAEPMIVYNRPQLLRIRLYS